jgi:hypothetical protein
LTRRYIHHSNKALRPLNMHLNMRRPRPSFPIPFFRSSHASPTSVPPAKPLATRRQSMTSSTVIATIPPSNNPRGELIFSSRVDRGFREGYERYRSAFERRREEKAREEARRNAKWFRRASSQGTGIGTPTPPASRRGTPPPSLRGRTPSPGLSGSRLRNSIDLSGRPPSPGKLPGEKGEGEDGKGVNLLKSSLREKRERAESYSFVWNREEVMPRRAP